MYNKDICSCFRWLFILNFHLNDILSIYSDRIRTVVNVFGDCVGAAIVHHLNKDHLIKPEVSDDDAEKVTDEVVKDSVWIFWFPKFLYFDLY